MAKTILVVDDEREVRDAIRDSLSSQGYVVTTVASAPEAVELVEKLPPDFCLIDIIMPGVSGYVACQEIKRIAESTQVVMMSGGFLSKADIQLCYQLGADGYLAKPFKLWDLIALIEGGRVDIAPPAVGAAVIKEPPKPAEPVEPKAEAAKMAAAQPPPETSLVNCPECKAVFRMRQDRLAAAKFKFRCPKCDYVFVLKTEQETAAAAVVSPPPEEEVKGPLAKKILVVDDTEFFRRYISDLLIEQGYRVIEAKNGQQALMEVEHEKPDLVLSDLLLPGIHGFELCQKIKALPLGYPIKVVFMTGVYKDLSYQQDAQKKYGADGYLIKPIKDEELLGKIRELLGPSPV